jgi:hypothetical protein
MRVALVISAGTLFVLAGLHALDGEWLPAVVLGACSVVTAVARERF